MRVYIPATLDLLREWHSGGLIPAGDDRFVTSEADEDEVAEYGAMLAAADASAALQQAQVRRVVVVVDAADADAVIGWDRVVAVHADTAVVDPADRDLPDPAWFATQEVTDLLGR